MEQNPQPIQSTQIYLDISEIRDGIIILKDGSLRTVLLASAVNFELKSESEQNAIEYAYQNFLNSLDFPIQIVAQSRKLYLDGYVRKLEELPAQQDNEFLQVQTQAYLDFVKTLLEYAVLMDKKFYVIIPFFTAQKKGGVLSDITKVFQPQQKVTLTEEAFETYKSTLLQRTNLVAQNLASTGVRCVSLNTQELAELFYSIYNPQVAEYEKLAEIGKVLGGE